MRREAMPAATVAKLGPDDLGRRMRLADFDEAETEEGCFFELSRGIIVRSQDPQPRLLYAICEVRRQFQTHGLANPASIQAVGGGGECKLFLPSWDSERHPDLAIYTLAPPRGKNVWARWVPDIVLEILSPGSEERDYILKREEYLDFGIKEYWILDLDAVRCSLFAECAIAGMRKQ
jgi:hypothetical protein